MMIDLNNGLIMIRNPDRKYVKRPIIRIITDEYKMPIFLDRKVKLQPGQAVIAIFWMKDINSLSDTKQVCLVPNPNSPNLLILGRSFSVTRNGLCASVLLNTLDTMVSMQRRKETWLHFADEDRLRADTKLEEIFREKLPDLC